MSAKTKAARDATKKTVSKAPENPSPQTAPPELQIVLDETELESAVCDLIAKGLSVGQICEEMRARYGRAGRMNREKPYRILRKAAKRGRVMYVPPTHLALENRIHKKYFWLKRVSVVHTAVSIDVAREAAQMLLQLVQECYRTDNKNEVHIGFASGRSMQQLAHAFAELLCQPVKDLPEKIFFHAMVTGYDPGNPTTDPNAFFTFFLNNPVLPIEPRFVAFHAPAMVNNRSMRVLKENQEIADAYKAAKQLDIIATSGSDWTDDHSSLKLCMKRSPESMEKLENEGTIGDMLWRPIGEKGPILTATVIRAMTLKELTDLPGFIKKGKHVLLMIGPCAMCNVPKGRILKTIINQDEHLISHLVADSRSAGQLIENMKN